MVVDKNCMSGLKPTEVLPFLRISWRSIKNFIVKPNDFIQQGQTFISERVEIFLINPVDTKVPCS